MYIVIYTKGYFGSDLLCHKISKVINLVYGGEFLTFNFFLHIKAVPKLVLYTTDLKNLIKPRFSIRNALFSISVSCMFELKQSISYSKNRV